MIKGKMEQQLSVLKELDELITRSDTDGKTGTATAEDIEHLRKYVSDMRRACNTAIALETAGQDEKKSAKRKAKTKAKEAEAAEREPEKSAEEVNPENAEAEDDDLGFLD